MFELLRNELGLELNIAKCFLLPLGAKSVEEVRSHVTFTFPLGHAFYNVAVTDRCRWLGFALSRGDFHPHRHMIERMGARG
eukprot:1505272-Amphidinium_carterae.1